MSTSSQLLAASVDSPGMPILFSELSSKPNHSFFNAEPDSKVIASAPDFQKPNFSRDTMI
jgi:hypothetical protein